MPRHIGRLSYSLDCDGLADVPEMPDFIPGFVPPTKKTSGLVLIVDGSKSALVDTQLLEPPSEEGGSTIMSYYSLSTPFYHLGAGPRVAFKQDGTECYVFRPVSYGNSNTVQVDKYSELVNKNPVAPADPDNPDAPAEPLPYNTPVLSHSVRYRYSNMGVHNLYLGGKYPYNKDTGAYDVKLPRTAADIHNMQGAYQGHTPYVMGVTASADADTSGTFYDELDTNVPPSNIPYFSSRSLNSFNYQIVYSDGMNNTNKYQSDLVYSLFFPVNVQTRPEVLFEYLNYEGSVDNVLPETLLSTSTAAPFKRLMYRIHQLVAFETGAEDTSSYNYDAYFGIIIGIGFMPIYTSPSYTVERTPYYFPVNVSKSTLVTSAMYDNTDFCVRMMQIAWFYTATVHEWWVNLAHSRGLFLLKIAPKGPYLPSTALAEDTVGSGNSSASMWPDAPVIGYGQNRLTQEEYFHIDAFTWVKHRFHYSKYEINLGLLYPPSENEVGTILIGGLNVTFDNKSFKHTDYHYESSVTVGGKTTPGRWVMDDASNTDDLVHVSGPLNPAELRKQTSRDALLPQEGHSFEQTYCGSHDTVIAWAEESEGALFEIDENSEWIIMGLNSQRGVVDNIFNNFADQYLPWLDGKDGAIRPTTITYTYYSVLLLLSNESTEPRTPFPNWNTKYAEEHKELYWMGCCSQRTDHRKYWTGFETEVVMGANRARSILLSEYGDQDDAFDWKYVFLETTVTATIQTNLPGKPSGLESSTSTHYPFPLGACTSTPTAFHIKGAYSTGATVDVHVPMQITDMTINTTSVRQIGETLIDSKPMCFPKVHFYKEHVFSYTEDYVFAFKPGDEVSSVANITKKAKCSFVQQGVGKHTYIDRFDQFIELGGFGDYIISLGEE